MGTSSFILAGSKPSEGDAFSSAIHGAGRAMSGMAAQVGRASSQRPPAGHLSDEAMSEMQRSARSVQGRDARR